MVGREIKGMLVLVGIPGCMIIRGRRRRRGWARGTTIKVWWVGEALVGVRGYIDPAGTRSRVGDIMSGGGGRRRRGSEPVGAVSARGGKARSARGGHAIMGREGEREGKEETRQEE